MPSIAQAQAAFLQSGGAEASGSSKGLFYSVKTRKDKTGKISFEGQFDGLGIVESLLAQYIGEFLQKAAENLNASKSITTGNLEDSLDYQVIPISRGYRVNLVALDYYDFVDKGVQGVVKSRSKNTTSPYKFRFVNPSKNHVEAIRKWIVDNNLTAQVTDVSRYGATQREAKGERMPLEAAAWLVARNIKRKGTKATNFWQKAFDETFADFDAKMLEAVGEGIKFEFQVMGKKLKK